MNNNKGYRTLDEIEAEYFKKHPYEIDSYINEIFTDYSEDGDLEALLSSLRVIARVKGISCLAEEIDMSRQGIQKALSNKGNPRFDSISSIMKAMGFRLMPIKLTEHNIVH